MIGSNQHIVSDGFFMGLRGVYCLLYPFRARLFELS